MSEKDLAAKQRGAILGLAYGDAWGWITEFANYKETQRVRPAFPAEAIVTDDTQMSLYAMNAILNDVYLRSSKIKAFDADRSETNGNAVRIEFAEAFINWYYDEDNTRAPGVTCMEALKKITLLDLETGLEGTNEWSKGCGANMRNPWFGLLPYDVDMIAELSVIQSSVTHNNPLALSSSAITALVVRGLVTGEVTPGGNNVMNYAIDMTEHLIQNPFDTLNLGYMDGLLQLKEFLIIQRDLTHVLDDLDESTDICHLFGEGKIAEEALALAIVAVDRYQDDVMSGYRRLVHSSGDTDSIAAIAGSFFGAAYGDSVFPAEWFDRLEPRYQKELDLVIGDVQDLI